MSRILALMPSMRALLRPSSIAAMTSAKDLEPLVRALTALARLPCRADGIHDSGAEFPYRADLSRQHRLGGGVGVERVGFAFHAALPSVRAFDLDHGDPFAGQVTG
jgi:hypothetical protein